MASALDEAITSVAVLVDDAQEFRARATAVALQLGPAIIDEIVHAVPLAATRRATGL
jgi:hypothetical protein